MTTSNKPKPKPPGRPAGAKNITTTADVTPSRCPKCGSSRRTPYSSAREKRFAAGIVPAAIVYRRTSCEDCGQVRIDREPIFEPDAKK